MGSTFHQGAKGAGSSDWKKTLTQAANTPQSPLQEVRNLRVQDHSGKKFGGKGKGSGKLREEQNKRVFPFFSVRLRDLSSFIEEKKKQSFLTRKLALHSASSIRTELFKRQDHLE